MSIFVLLLFSFISTNQVSAESLETLDETVMIDGKSYTATQTVKGPVVKTILTGAEGTIELVRVADEFTSLDTDFMSKKEEAQNLAAVNKISVDVSESAYVENGNTYTTSSIYNTWRYGTWKNYKITAEGKITTVILTTLILSYIPYVGKIAGAMAGIFLTYNLKVGYFSAKKDTMLLFGNYIKQKQHLKLFKQSNYTQLLSYKTTERTDHMADQPTV
ncbi:hypothetical protein A1A1_18367 [Planococcus antarcticus DSM 14505]|uniref:Uncharacterized protein n=2 Tax=Planococcus TaxID=1372 RepID=A0AA87IHU1_9BACL|nr:hypothetical protein A1A1_18367 [Planococcus antarcticus DSM 14505]